MHLAPAIVQQIYGPVKELDVIALEPELERLVTQALTSPHGAALDPGVADTLTRSAADTAQQAGRPGPAGLPAGARPDPRADGAPAQARRARA
jgi:flagellar biosynthesis protein FlhA